MQTSYCKHCTLLHPATKLVSLLVVLLQITQVLRYHVSDVGAIATPFTNRTITTLSTLFTDPLGLVAPSTVVAVGSRAGVVTPNIYYPGVSVM
jgi:hypothetical protein